jgi:hypothetical protein
LLGIIHDFNFQQKEDRRDFEITINNSALAAIGVVTHRDTETSELTLYFYQLMATVENRQRTFTAVGDESCSMENRQPNVHSGG